MLNGMGTLFQSFEHLFAHPFAALTPIEQLQLTPMLIFAVLEFCLSTAYLALWRAAPDYRVFRKMGVFLAVVGVEEFWEYLGGGNSAWVLRDIAMILLIPTAAEAMRIPIRRWKWLLWPVLLVALIGGLYPSTQFVRDWPIFLSQIALATLIVRGFHGGNAQDRKIAGAFTALFLVRMTISTTFQQLTGISGYVVIGGWHWLRTGFVLTLLGAVTLAIFVRDLIHDRQEKIRLATELEAARSVQSILIPEDPEEIQGYSLTSTYRPALEVGGDFFQVIPLHDGQTMIVLGDVSGKGLKAAMAVSFIIGALRTLAESNSSPADILAGLDHRLHGRLQGGFATAIALRLGPDGQCWIASAGHPAPFLNAVEVEVPGALPLGLGLAGTYEQASFHLRAGDQLTLYTDGLLEARSPAGELFSFDRLKTLFAANPTAEQATEAAVAFGQDDDITVLTLTRLATAAGSQLLCPEANAADVAVSSRKSHSEPLPETAASIAKPL